MKYHATIYSCYVTQATFIFILTEDYGYKVIWRCDFFYLQNAPVFIHADNIEKEVLNILNVHDKVIATYYNLSEEELKTIAEIYLNEI